MREGGRKRNNPHPALLKPRGFASYRKTTHPLFVTLRPFNLEPNTPPHATPCPQKGEEAAERMMHLGSDPLRRSIKSKLESHTEAAQGTMAQRTSPLFRPPPARRPREPRKENKSGDTTACVTKVPANQRRRGRPRRYVDQPISSHQPGFECRQ